MARKNLSATEKILKESEIIYAGRYALVSNALRDKKSRRKRVVRALNKALEQARRDYRVADTFRRTLGRVLPEFASKAK